MVTKLAADPYWSGYDRDRLEANRADDELVTLLRRKLSRRLAGQIKDIVDIRGRGQEGQDEAKVERTKDTESRVDRCNGRS